MVIVSATDVGGQRSNPASPRKNSVLFSAVQLNFFSSLRLLGRPATYGVRAPVAVASAEGAEEEVPSMPVRCYGAKINNRKHLF